MKPLDTTRLKAVHDLRDACERILAGRIMGESVLLKAEKDAARLAKSLFAEPTKTTSPKYEFKKLGIL